MTLRHSNPRWLSGLLEAPRAAMDALRAEWEQILHDKSLLVMLLFLPLLYAVTVAYLYRHESVVNAPVIVVDEDGGAKARHLLSLIDATQEARIVDRAESVDAAFVRLRRNEASAVLFIPKGFEEHVLRKEPAKLKLWIDSANMLTYGTAYAGIRAAISEMDNELSRDALIAKGISRKQAGMRTSPIELSERLLFHPTGSYGGFMAPAVFVVALQQAILLAFAVSAGTRRETTSEPDFRQPHAYSRLLGRFLVHLPFHLASAAVIAVLTHHWYRFPAMNTLGVFVLLAIFAVATGPLAILVSLPFRNGRTPMQVLMLVSTPLFLASGYTWPLSQMPEVVQCLAKLAPSTPTLAGLSVVAMRTGEIGELQDAAMLLTKLFGGYLLTGVVVVAVLRMADRWRGRTAGREAGSRRDSQAAISRAVADDA